MARTGPSKKHARDADTVSVVLNEKPRKNVDQQAIRERAYQIFRNRGDQNADPVADWLEAERQLSNSRET
jgi:hypothetical protein